MNNDFVCPFDGTEVYFQNWDYYCPECGHCFDDGDGIITKEEYDSIHKGIE